MALPNGFWYYVASGFLLLILPVVFIGNIWLRGFFWKFVNVKASMGKKILIRIGTVNTDHFAVAEILDGAVHFKDRKKKGHITPLTDKSVLYRAWGIGCLDYDEDKDCFFKRDGTGVTGHDAELVDSLILRALMKPVPQNLLLIIVLIIVILLLIMLGFELYLTTQLKNQLAQLAINTAGSVTKGINP